MKRIFLFTLCTLLLMGCGPSAPAATPTPTDAPQTLPETMGDPIPTFLPTLWVEEGQKLDCDLNGDGEIETVEIESVKVNEYMEYRTLRVSGGGLSISAGETMIQYGARICLTDLEYDGVYEIFLSGDVASDDYITYGCRWTGSSLAPISFAAEDGGSAYSMNGCVVETGTGLFWISDHLFMLGTYLGYRAFTMGIDDRIEPADGYIWEFRDNDFWLETAADLTEELPAGTKIRLTGADGVSQVWYVTEDGREGSLSLSESEDKWGWCINGLHELECFVMLPYAG